MKYSLAVLKHNKCAFMTEDSMTYFFTLEDYEYKKTFVKLPRLGFESKGELIMKLKPKIVLETDRIDKKYIQEHFPELYI